MTDLLLRTLLVGLSAAGLVVALRATPLIQRLVREQKKPWACDVCMSFWCTLAVAGVAVCFEENAFTVSAPGFAVTLLVLRKLTEPVKLPPNLPELEDSE